MNKHDVIGGWGTIHMGSPTSSGIWGTAAANDSRIALSTLGIAVDGALVNVVE